MRRKRYMDALRTRLDQSLELAITDQLTGLYNRRFLFAQLDPLVQRAQCGGDSVSVMVVDSTTSNASTTPSATMSATRCCANSPCASARTCAVGFRLPPRRRGVRRDHAAHHGRRRVPRRRAPAPHICAAPFIGLGRERTARRHRLHRRRLLGAPGRQRRKRCSSAPTRRSTKPSAPAATACWGKPPRGRHNNPEKGVWARPGAYVMRLSGARTSP